MRIVIRILLLLAVLGATFSLAQNPPIQHVIVVVQENRTPDNLFQQDSTLITNGADIASSGSCHGTGVPLHGRPLADCYDSGHGHKGPWVSMYDNGLMDGACDIQISVFGLCNPPVHPQYVYIDNSSGVVSPYFQIAERYGYGNYMFQTNQGPSLPAHQFLLSGSSSPSGVMNPLYAYFDAENSHGPNGSILDSGCSADPTQYALLIDPQGTEGSCPNDIHCAHPCYEHPTLTDLLDNHKDGNGNPQPITWRYYSDQEKSYWTAPNAISHLCNNDAGNHGCGTGMGSNHDWTTNVKPYLEKTRTTLAPFLVDVSSPNCQLAQVTWVIPDGRWSDHPGSIGLGPDWVANIVNSIGTSPCHDVIGGKSYSFWQDSVILITWDDWGGWYDHISPQNTIHIGYPNNTGQKYVYGFRVPLLVVSPYVKLTNGNPGYISGPKTSPIYYDFGSILLFIENTFGLLGGSVQGINPIYPYADQFAGLRTPLADLSDFFDYTQTQRTFSQPITLHNDSTLCNMNKCMSNQCDATCFINYPGNPQAPELTEGDESD